MKIKTLQTYFDLTVLDVNLIQPKVPQGLKHFNLLSAF